MADLGPSISFFSSNGTPATGAPFDGSGSSFYGFSFPPSENPQTVDYATSSFDLTFLPVSDIVTVELTSLDFSVASGGTLFQGAFFSLASYEKKDHGTTYQLGFLPPVIVTSLPSGTSQTRYYRMAAYRTIQQDTEVWTAVGSPNNTNPSGQPIANVRVLFEWTQ